MLSSIKDMHGFKIYAKDGEIGKVDEFFFEDHTWTIRYLVAHTGMWSVDNRVLISPVSIGKPNWGNKIFLKSRLKTVLKQKMTSRFHASMKLSLRHTIADQATGQD